MRHTARWTKLCLVPLFAAALTVAAAGTRAADRDAVTQRVRAELATLLKKDASKLPLDKPVTELGADELTVVEWTMSIERAFKVRIRDEKTNDPKTRLPRKDLSIATMTGIALEAIDQASTKR